jgi:uncharacterized protein YecE (DUF72 family)
MIGTSGWSYANWKEIFYPAEIKSKEWLGFYAKHLPTVELNNSFYAVPRITTIENWILNTPDDYLFSCKAWNVITHKKKLVDTAEALEKFLIAISGFGSKLGPILFQLPPFIKKDTQLLEDFLKLLPKHQRFVVEFRHVSWFDDEVYALLKQYNVAFCVFELGKFHSPWIITADFVYVRLHGRQRNYRGNYDDEMLAEYAKWIKAHYIDAYVYFDNTMEGSSAIDNAISLTKMLNN